MSEEVRSKLRWPAIGLLATGVLGILWHIASAILSAVYGGGSLGLYGIPSEAIYFQVGIDAFCALVYVFLVFCSVKMMNLSSYPLAMTAAILAMIPCNCCCLLGLPVGIWAIVLLVKPEVKAAFGSAPAESF